MSKTATCTNYKIKLAANYRRLYMQNRAKFHYDNCYTHEQSKIGAYGTCY